MLPFNPCAYTWMWMLHRYICCMGLIEPWPFDYNSIILTYILKGFGNRCRIIPASNSILQSLFVNSLSSTLLYRVICIIIVENWRLWYIDDLWFILRFRWTVEIYLGWPSLVQETSGFWLIKVGICGVFPVKGVGVFVRPWGRIAHC